MTHKIAFDQVKDGTGSYIEINPNHRYTVEITRADRYHVDFTFKIADWEEGEDMGIVIPDNSVGAISAQPEGLYDAKKKTLILSTTAGLNCTLNLSSNAALSVESVTYDKPGFDWIEVGEVVMVPATTRNGLWTQTGTCPIRTRTGVFDEYPNATLTLKNKASGEKMTIKVTPPEDFIVVVPEGSGNRRGDANDVRTPRQYFGCW